MSVYRTDDAFGPVPKWLLESDVSDRAIRLYALLSAERDYGTDMAQLGRKLLASKLKCSVDSLDRAKAELLEADAITVTRGMASDGSREVNIYTIHRASAGSRTRAVQVAANGGGVAAPVRPSLLIGDESSSSSSRNGRAPTQIGGKKVTSAEAQFADEVLAAFNEVSGRRFGSKEALGKIVLRHREHPELDVPAHRALIEEQFAAPWWRGEPSPAVIYGNGEVFDRAANGVRGRGAGRVMVGTREAVYSDDRTAEEQREAEEREDAEIAAEVAAAAPERLAALRELDEAVKRGEWEL